MIGFKWRWIPLILLVVLISSGAGFVLWATSVPDILPEAEIALQDDTQLNVVQADNWIEFTPLQTDDITTGYIIYPGGRVPAEAYAPLARAIAEEGYFVSIVYAPLNLAFFNTGAAAAVIEAHPEVTAWAVGGHSLGGVAAADFTANHPEQIQGLILMASQTIPGKPLNTYDELAVVSIYGTNDGLITPDEVLAEQSNLPSDTQFVEILGGNHAQFGWYGEQAGDSTATISREAQQEEIIMATVSLLEQLAGD